MSTIGTPQLSEQVRWLLKEYFKGRDVHSRDVGAEVIAELRAVGVEVATFGDRCSIHGSSRAAAMRLFGSLSESERFGCQVTP